MMYSLASDHTSISLFKEYTSKLKKLKSLGFNKFCGYNYLMNYFTISISGSSLRTKVINWQLSCFLNGKVVVENENDLIEKLFQLKFFGGTSAERFHLKIQVNEYQIAMLKAFQSNVKLTPPEEDSFIEMLSAKRRQLANKKELGI